MDDKTPDNPIPVAAQAKDRTDLAFAGLIAVGLAGVLLVTVVLPAEYGIDPTGFGRLTGIDDLSEGGGSDVGRSGVVSRVEDGPPRNHTFSFELAGLQDDEYKLHMLANQSILYTWTSTGPVNFDFHGDPDRPSRPGEFSSYEDAQDDSRSGSFQAPFDGRHGWYFQNVGGQPVTITLEVWGYYDVIGLLG
jgi:hypothetical protein